MQTFSKLNFASWINDSRHLQDIEESLKNLYFDPIWISGITWNVSQFNSPVKRNQAMTGFCTFGCVSKNVNTTTCVESQFSFWWGCAVLQAPVGERTTYFETEKFVLHLILFNNIWYRPRPEAKSFLAINTDWTSHPPTLHTSYLSFHLHRHSLRLKYFTLKTPYLWLNFPPTHIEANI